MDIIEKTTSSRQLLIHLFNSNEKLKYDEDELKRILALFLSDEIFEGEQIPEDILSNLMELEKNLHFFSKKELEKFKLLNNKNTKALLDGQTLVIVITKYLIALSDLLNDKNKASLIEYKTWLKLNLKSIKPYCGKTVFLFCKLIESYLETKLVKANYYSNLLRKSWNSIFFELLLKNKLFPLIPEARNSKKGSLSKFKILKQINTQGKGKCILFFEMSAKEFRCSFSHLLLNILNEDSEEKFIFCFHIKGYDKNCENVISNTLEKYNAIKPQILIISHSFSNNTYIDNIDIYYELMKAYNLPILKLENNIFIQGQKVRDAVEAMLIKLVDLAATGPIHTINKNMGKPTQLLFVNNSKASVNYLITLKKLLSKFSYDRGTAQLNALYSFLIRYSFNSLKRFYKDTLTCKNLTDYILVADTKSKILEENLENWLKVYDHSFYSYPLGIQAGEVNQIPIKLHILDEKIDDSKPQVICVIESETCEANKLAEQLELEYSPSLKAPFMYLYHNKDIYELNIPKGVNALNFKLKVWNFNNKNVFISFKSQKSYKS